MGTPRPGVQGAPAASSSPWSFLRSTSIVARISSRIFANPSAAISYSRRTVAVIGPVASSWALILSMSDGGATSFRRWRVDRLTAAKNADGSRAIDDNSLKNYSGKGVWQVAQGHKLSVS